MSHVIMTYIRKSINFKDTGLDVKAPCPGQVKIPKSQFGQVILAFYLPDREGKYLQCDRYSIAKTHPESLIKQYNSLPVMSSVAGLVNN